MEDLHNLPTEADYALNVAQHANRSIKVLQDEINKLSQDLCDLHEQFAEHIHYLSTYGATGQPVLLKRNK
jgi:hypothetical protein